MAVAQSGGAGECRGRSQRIVGASRRWGSGPVFSLILMLIIRFINAASRPAHRAAILWFEHVAMSRHVLVVVFTKESRNNTMSIFTDARKTSDQPKRTERRRGWLLYIKRALLALLALLLALPVLGFSYETIAAAVDARRFPPPGRLIAVDGHRMHINCTGTGGPTVVLDAGLGGWSLDWSAVQPEIAQFTRVCSYDRAGLGWSAPGAIPGDAQHAVDDLHTLLATSGEVGPFVLVGHSNGGLRAALYAQAYPQEVAGVVLIDPTPRATDDERVAFLSPTEQAEYMALLQGLKPEPEASGFDFFGLMQALRPFGIPRLLTDTFLEGSLYTYLRPEVQPAFQFGINQPARIATYIAEGEHREANVAQVRAVGSLGSVPLAVLASTKFTDFYRDPLPADLPPRLVELIQKTAWEAKVDMSRLSTNSTITPVERSGHYIQFDRPDAVIQAVQHMVQSFQGR
jgi:pimeloyl-ACP methyl ester carboxylesterase